MVSYISLQIANEEEIRHHFLIEEKYVTRFISDAVLLRNYNSNSIIEGYFHFDGNFIPVFSLAHYFGLNLQKKEDGDIIVFKISSGKSFAITGVLSYNYVDQEDLTQNNSFGLVTGVLLDEEHIISEEYALKNLNNNRYFLINTKKLITKLESDITSGNIESLGSLKERLSQIPRNEHVMPVSTSIGITTKEETTRSHKINNEYLVFELDKQKFAIASEFIVSLDDGIKFMTSVNEEKKYFKGITKSIFGSVNIFNLREYFDLDISEINELIIVRYGEDSHLGLLVDRICSLEIIESYEISEIYPLSNSTDTYYKGIFTLQNEIIFIFNSELLLQCLYEGKKITFSKDTKFTHHKDHVSNNIDTIEKENMVIWIGNETIIGFNIEKVFNLTNNFELQPSKTDYYSSFTFEDQKVPVFHLTEYLQIERTKPSNLVLIYEDEELFGLKIDGEVSTRPLQHLGFINEKNLKTRLFNNIQDLILDVTIYSEFIGYLIDTKQLLNKIKNDTLVPYKYIIQETLEEVVDFVLVQEENVNFFFSLNEIKSLHKERREQS